METMRKLSLPTPCSRFLVVILAVPLLSFSCRSSSWKRQLLDVKTNSEIESGFATYLEWEEEEGQVLPQGFAQPVEIRADELEHLLRSLQYYPEQFFGLVQGKEKRRLFSIEEAEFLAAPLSRGMARAGPDQRVRFLLKSGLSHKLLKGPRSTSGVIFITELDQLNLAFDSLRQSSSTESDPEALVFDDPVEVTAKSPELIQLPFATLNTGAPAGKVFSRWLVVNREQLASSLQSAAEQRPTPPADTALNVPPEPDPAPPPRPESLLDPEMDALKKKLGNLDQLLEDGTIDQEEYEKARFQILLQSER